MFGITGAGYDTSTSIYSPDGRIFAAEYAKKAVEQGATSIGIQVKEGVVLLAEKRLMPLQEPDSVEKISEIETHVGVATSGFMADARKLVRIARVAAQNHWFLYEEPVPAEALAEAICDEKAQFTQGRGRPYGVSLIIGSVDFDGSPKIFVTDPVGTFWGFLAAVIGRGSSRAGEFLEKNYDTSGRQSLEKTIELALEALQEASDSELTADNIEIATIPVSTKKYHKLTHEEKEAIISPSGSKRTTKE